MKTITKNTMTWGIIAITFIALTAFLAKKEDTKYGGSATMVVEARPNAYSTDHAVAMQLDGVEKGDRRTISVTVSCDYEDYSAAKEALKYELEQKTKIYEMEVTSATYFIDYCDN